MSAISANSAVRASSPTDGFSTLGSDEFIKVMFAELSRQDPLQPNDTSKLLEQLGQIRSIESDLALQKNLEGLIRQNEITSAGGLIGKFAVGTTDANDRVQGYVDSISVTREGVRLNLSTGFQVRLSRLEQIVDPALVSPTNPPPPGSGGGDDDDEETPSNPTGGPSTPTTSAPPRDPTPQPVGGSGTPGSSTGTGTPGGISS